MSEPDVVRVVVYETNGPGMGMSVRDILEQETLGDRASRRRRIMRLLGAQVDLLLAEEDVMEVRLMRM